MTTIPHHASGSPAGVLLARAQSLRRNLAGNFRDDLVQAIYDDAHVIAGRAVKASGNRTWDWDQKIDRVITSPVFGLPLMLVLLMVVFWITIIGANYPSSMLATGLFWVEEVDSCAFDVCGAHCCLT